GRAGRNAPGPRHRHAPPGAADRAGPQGLGRRRRRRPRAPGAPRPRHPPLPRPADDAVHAAGRARAAARRADRPARAGLVGWCVARSFRLQRTVHPVLYRPVTTMRKITLALAFVLAGCAGARAQTPAPAGDPHLEIARRVLSTTPLFDGHNDLPWAIRSNRAAPRDVVAYDLRKATPGHTDIQRLRDGMVGAQFWSVYIPYGAVREGAAKVQLEQIDIALQIFDRYPDVFGPAFSPSDVEREFGRGRIASVLGMEGGHAIENSLGALRALYALGVRYMTLTHSNNIDWADSCCEPPVHGGLTEFGKEVVREMNRLGMLVDLSHVSPETMHDALDVTEAPVIFSHSSARAVTDHPRNVPDDVLRRLPENGGVVMVTFVPSFINEEVRRFSELPREIGRASCRES